MTVFSVKHRKSATGVPGVAPFIDGMNVWDIPTAQWTDAVKSAIVHAYFLGRASAEKDMCEAVRVKSEPFTMVWEKDDG